MKDKPFILAVLVAVILPAAASAHHGAYGVAIRTATVNPDHSVTIMWTLESTNVSDASITVDGAIVRNGPAWATTFTTRPLSGGRHTITIEAHEFFETYTPSGSSCMTSGGHWVCVRNWYSSMSVSVPWQTYCVVPTVVGLQLTVAKARITTARCSMGAVERVHSKRQAGTVLTQRPTKTRRLLPNATPVRLVVSIGER